MATTGPTGIRLDPLLDAYHRTSTAIGVSKIRLATGTRIIHSGDDSTALTAASFLQSQNSALRGSLQNGAHATTLLQIASNGLSQIRTILDSLSDLTANANTAGTTHRQYILLDTQFQTQLQNIDSIVASTTYNGANLLDGTFSGAGAAPFQLGNVASGTINVDIPDVTSTGLFPSATSLTNAANATVATTNVTNAQDLIADAIGRVLAYQSRLDEAEKVTLSSIGGQKNAITGLIGTDVPAETNALALNKLQQHTGAAVIAQALGLNSSLLTLIH